MPNINVKLKKLVDVDVEFVSLVKRGANRLPIRVIKSEDATEESNMSFLDTLFGKNEEASKDESSEPEITAIITDNDNAEVMEKQLEGLGFSVAEKQEVEGGTVFRQGELTSDDVIIQLSSSTYVAVKNVQKAFEPFSSGTSFGDNFKKGAFFPSVRMATDVLMETIVEVMFADEGDTAPTDAVKKTLSEFSSFVLTSLKSIPKDAFKLEEIMVKAEKSASHENKNSTAKTEDESVDIEKVTKDVSESVTKSLGAMFQTDAEKAVAKMEEIKKSISETLVAVKEEINEKLAGFDTDIKALKAVSEGVDKRLEKAETKTDDLEKAVKGTVADGSTDAEAEKEVSKSEEDKRDIWEGSLAILDSHGE